MKNYEQYIKLLENEGVPAGVTTLSAQPGMGNPTLPTETTLGSGDKFEPVGAVSEQQPRKKKKKKKKELRSIAEIFSDPNFSIFNLDVMLKEFDKLKQKNNPK